MAHLKLRLTGTPDVALTGSSFYHASAPREVAYRPVAEPSAPEVSLSAGLRAFVILALQSAAAGRRARPKSGSASAALRGGPESPAAGLARIVGGAHASQLDPIFGCDSRGSSFVQQFLTVETFEERTVQFVSVSFNRCLLLPNEIHIHWNGVPLEDPEILDGLANTIEQEWTPFAAQQRGASSDAFLPFLKKAFKRELNETLGRSDSEPGDVRRRLQALQTHPELSAFGSLDLLADLQLFHSKVTARLTSSGAAGKLPLRIAVPPSLVSALALFRYLEHEEPESIVLDYDFAYSNQVVQSIYGAAKHRRPDLCVLALPTAIRESRLGLPQFGGYRPVMLLPQTTHRIIAPAKAFERCRSGRAMRRYHFMTQVPGTGHIYFRELVKSGYIRTQTTSVEQTEPNRLLSALADGDPESRAIIWFPHYDLNCLLNGCSLIDKPKDSLAHQGIILLASEEIRRNPVTLALLTSALRRAWQVIRDDSAIQDKIVDSLIGDSAYLSVLLRSGGMSESIASRREPGKDLGRSGREEILRGPIGFVRHAKGKQHSSGDADQVRDRF